MRANIKRMYADIGGKLGLSQEDANKLIDLMMDQQMATMDRVRRGTRQRAGDPWTAPRSRAKISRRTWRRSRDLIGARQDRVVQEVPGDSAGPPGSRDCCRVSWRATTWGCRKDQRDRWSRRWPRNANACPAAECRDSASARGLQRRRCRPGRKTTTSAPPRAPAASSTADQQATYDEYQQWSREMRADLRDAACRPRDARRARDALRADSTPTQTQQQGEAHAIPRQLPLRQGEVRLRR